MVVTVEVKLLEPIFLFWGYSDGQDLLETVSTFLADISLEYVKLSE